MLKLWICLEGRKPFADPAVCQAWALPTVVPVNLHLSKSNLWLRETEPPVQCHIIKVAELGWKPRLFLIKPVGFFFLFVQEKITNILFAIKRLCENQKGVSLACCQGPAALSPVVPALTLAAETGW